MNAIKSVGDRYYRQEEMKCLGCDRYLRMDAFF
jgi:hypothetical protein